MIARRAHGLLAAALFVLCFASPAAAAPGGASLSSLVNRYVSWRLARAPHAARRPEPHAEDPLAPTVAPATRNQERAWLAAFRADLDAARPRGAQGSEPFDAEVAGFAMLSAAVRYDSLELEVLRPYERDPSAYLDLLAASVQAALDRASDSPCVRVRLTIRRLREVPEVLRTARINLANPPRLLTERAVERARALLRFVRADLPGLVSACRAPRSQAELAEADTLAVRSVEEFLAFLEHELLPASHGELAIGPEACRSLIATMLMTDVAPIDSLLAEGMRQIEMRRAELDSLASVRSGAGTRAILDSLPAAVPVDADPAVSGRQAAESVRDFLRQSDFATVPAKLNLKLRAALAIDPPDEPALAPGDAGEPRKDAGWLGIPPADRLGRYGLDLGVAVEVGRWLREQAARQDESRLGRAMRDAWPGRDWGRYCERTLIEAGYGSRDPRIRLVFAARELEEAGQSWVALALHAGALSPEEARRTLAERCLLDSARAEREVRSAASDARLMGYTIGAQRLLELQEEAWRRLGPRFRTRSFNDAVLRCGVAPYGFVRARVWHELAVAAGNVPVGAEP